ncbi:MAG: hypothetical protein EOP18_09440 [Rhizobiaceae bacterium]|nr:MAG: hypothetical protein EOP18_09440 [Rhizobiaceae bacterium]
MLAQSDQEKWMSEVQQAGSLPPVRRLGQRSTLAYGFGAYAYGIRHRLSKGVECEFQVFRSAQSLHDCG